MNTEFQDYALQQYFNTYLDTTWEDFVKYKKELNELEILEDMYSYCDLEDIREALICLEQMLIDIYEQGVNSVEIYE
jgi:hypothetical protein